MSDGGRRWGVHPAYVPIDEELLRRSYVDERLTAEEIAARLGCAGNTVLRRLRRVGITVRPRGSPPKRYRQKEPIAWSARLAYAVGLIATDGNLSPDGRHLGIPSKDYDLLQTLRDCLGLQNRITLSKNKHRYIHRLQWSDRSFYGWLMTIGLSPAKSLRLGPRAVPEDYFVDFFRGCIDGDGSITTYVDRYNTFKKSTYVYTRLYVSLVSASPRFLELVRGTVRTLTGASGDLTVRRIAGRNDFWKLRYAKAESLRLLRWMYYAPNVPSLARKRNIAAPFLPVQSPPPRRGPGRPMVI